MTSRAFRAIFIIVVPLFLIACLEGGLRLFGYPTGMMAVLRSGDLGLYPPNFNDTLRWGPIPYHVQANSLGFRGEEVSFAKPAGTTRIAAIGDSMTDGFFVDNPDTYPARLQARLRRDARGPVEVLNAARGGGTIDRELAILKRAVAPLSPDVVLLTFVTNDIADLLNTPATGAVEGSPSTARRWATWLVAETALGELAVKMRVAMSARRRDAAAIPNAAGTPASDAPTAHQDPEQNARVFLERFANTDGRVLGRVFDPSTETLLTKYLHLLDRVREETVRQGAALIFIYMPAYPQVYLSDTSPVIQERLREACLRLGVPMLDLTPVFRAARQQPLYLAPIDFHLTPTGNGVMADAIADFLARQRIVPRGGA